MKRINKFQRLFMILLVLTLILLMISTNNSGNNSVGIRYIDCETNFVERKIYPFTDALCADISMISNDLCLIENNVSEEFIRLYNAGYSICGDAFLSLVLLITFTFLHFVIGDICKARCFTIKYIHDQDGQKSRFCIAV